MESLMIYKNNEDTEKLTKEQMLAIKRLTRAINNFNKVGGMQVFCEGCGEMFVSLSGEENELNVEHGSNQDKIVASIFTGFAAGGW